MKRKKHFVFASGRERDEEGREDAREGNEGGLTDGRRSPWAGERCGRFDTDGSIRRLNTDDTDGFIRVILDRNGNRSVYGVRTMARAHLGGLKDCTLTA